MKINFYFKLLGFLMIVLMFSMPFASLAQQHSEQSQAVAAAERDANARVNKAVSGILGCVGGWITVAGVYFYQPTPPAVPLLGKSPEYVAFYTDTYVEKSKSLQMNSALTGCLVGCVLYGAGTVVFLWTTSNPYDW